MLWLLDKLSGRDPLLARWIDDVFGELIFYRRRFPIARVMLAWLYVQIIWAFRKIARRAGMWGKMPGWLARFHDWNVEVALAIGAKERDLMI